MNEFDFELSDDCSYMASFKVYQMTTFDEIKLGACKYWGFEHFSE